MRIINHPIKFAVLPKKILASVCGARTVLSDNP